MWTQVLLPVLVAVVLFIAITVLMVQATFQRGGDVDRWAAISTIWLSLPVLFGGLIALVVLGALIALVTAAAQVIPPYSYQVQRFFYRIEYGTRQAATMVRRPILIAQGLLSAVRSGVRRAIERIR